MLLRIAYITPVKYVELENIKRKATAGKKTFRKINLKMKETKHDDECADLKQSLYIYLYYQIQSS